MWPLSVKAQEQEPAKLNISILEGEGSINNIRQRVAREAMVQVDDENHKPVGGAVVTFFLPDRGASGVFSNGSRTISVTTDNAGHALVRGIVPNKVAGQVQMRVVAKFRTLEANAVINTQNVAVAAAAGGAAGGVGGGVAAGAGISAKVIVIVALAAAGVAGGAVAVTRGGGSTPVTVSAGTPTVGAPPTTLLRRRTRY
jgi:hypothetical protein